ncbi:MAG TPA: HEPN domain-containing protein [Candidatus Limnocylindrales bacterium]|nr:HEPN domain-containing protein [Candidatus Limnocylindrales bacterium]
MPDPEAVAEVAMAWLRRARSDLVTARRALADRDELDPWVASFHAQQAAEKYLKAALVVEQIRFPRSHELERLRSLLPTGWTLPDEAALAAISRFAIAGRYPEGMFDAGAEPTWSDAEEAVRVADTIGSAVIDTARARGIGPAG